MRKLILFITLLLVFNCSNESDSNNNNDSYIEVTIDGTRFKFNNIVYEKYFENPDDKYYYVTATIEGRNDLMFDFDITVDLFSTSNSDEAIGELGLFVFDDFTLSDNPKCSYYADFPYSVTNVTVNTETEFRATFEFSTDDPNIFTDRQPLDCMFGEYVDYTNGVIHLKL